MTGDHLKNLLRSHADRREREYSPRPLPLTIEAVRLSGAPRRVQQLQMVAAGVAGAVTALALVAVIGSGIFATNGRTGGPTELNADPERPCRSADFEVRAEAWPDAPMAGGVLAIFEARDSTWCVIDRGFSALVADASDQVLVGSAVGVREPIQVKPGTAWQARIYWSTYCGSASGTVAAPEDPARPLTLSVAIGIRGDDLEGEEVTIVDTQIPLDTPTEIAPGPCSEEFPGSPFWLAPSGFAPYPGPPPD